MFAGGGGRSFCRNVFARSRRPVTTNTLRNDLQSNGLDPIPLTSEKRSGRWLAIVGFKRDSNTRAI